MTEGDGDMCLGCAERPATIPLSRCGSPVFCSVECADAYAMGSVGGLTWNRVTGADNTPDRNGDP